MGYFLQAAFILTIVGIVLTAKDKKCPGKGKPLKENGKELFCGWGLNRKDCPKGYSCVADPADKFAVCCPSAENEYKKGQYYAECKKNPCDGATCIVSDAICVPDYCGGCYARWYKRTARIHKCGTEGEFDCGIIVNCLVNPCNYESCNAFPGQKDCVPNYCGGCNTMWFKANARVPQCDSDFQKEKKNVY